MKAYYLLFLILLGCSQDDSDNFPKYTFNTSDLDFIPTVYEDLTALHTYQDTNGEGFALESAFYTRSMQPGGGIGSETPYFEYEHLLVQLQVIGTECELHEVEISKGKDKLYTQLAIRMMEDPCTLGTSFSFQEPYPLDSYSLNGITYSKVLTLTTTLPNTMSFGGYGIDTAYFDLKFGFLAFENSSTGQLFQLVGGNP